MSKYTNFDLRTFIAEGKNGKEDKMDEAGPGFDHDCAAHVVHETYGYGICLDGQHTLVETVEGKHVVTHYDVFFKEGNKTVKNVPVEDLDILNESSHKHSKKKNESDVANEGETVEEGTDLLQLIQNVDPATVGAVVGILGAIPSIMLTKLGVDRYCEKNSKNLVCRKLGEFGQDFSAAAKTGAARGGSGTTMEETDLTKEEVFKKEIKNILDS